MKITAKNYAAQAERALLEFTKKLPPDEYNVDIRLIDAQTNMIKSAIHFAVPDGGTIMNDNFKGLKDMEVRLPFPTITIEYFAGENQTGRPTDIVCKKRLVIACEVDRVFIENRIQTEIDSDKWILVYAACTLPDGLWVPEISAWAFPCKWDQKVEVKETIGRIDDSNRPRLIGAQLCLPKFYKNAVEKYGETIARENTSRDISMEVAVVMELCEALSCSNVTHEPIEKINQSVNTRRVRDGKLPLYETHCLIINAGKSSAATYGALACNHASPRQHLRRGHIRRLPEKNIWVNSCVVGDKNNGVIEKQYAVLH